MDKKKLIATLAAISLTIGAVGTAVACDNNTDPPPHEHTFDTTQWVSDGGDTHWHPATCEHEDAKDGEEKHVDADGDKFCDKCEKDMRQTVAITVAPTTGGTVTCDKLNPKEGETVTVTVAASTGYHVLSVKLGAAEQTLDANGKFTFKATAAATITATFEGNEITLDASAIDAQYGSVAFKFIEDGKNKYRYGDDVILHVTEDDEYILSALYINGDTTVNFADSMSEDGDILLTACKTETLTVTAEFVTRYTDVDITVKGTKLGTTANLAADTAVTFVGIDDAFTVGADGKITREHVEKGLYTVKVPGYQDKRIELNDNTREIVLEFDTFKELLHWGEFDFSKQNAQTPSLGATNDGAAFLSNETYDDVIASIYVAGKNIDAKSSIGVLFNFVGEDMNDVAMLNMQREIKTDKSLHKVHFAETTLWKDYDAPTDQYKMATGAGWKNLTYFYDCYDDDANRTADILASDWIDEYAAGTLKLSALRKGNTLYAYLGDICVGSQVVDAKYATAKCQVGFVLSCGNTGTMKTFNIGITDDADTIASSLRSTISISEDSKLDGVTAIPDKTEGAVMETAEFTITVPDRKKLKSFKINGHDVTSALVFEKLGQDNAEVYTYTYAMRKGGSESLVITATTEDVQYVALDATVKGHKLGSTDILAANTKVTFKGSRYSFTVGADGKISAQEVAVGTYTVSVDGYFDQQITIAKDSSPTEIVLEYDMFKIVRWDTADHDLSHVNDVDGYVAFKGPGSSLNVVSKEKLFDDVAVTVKLLGSNTNDGGKQQGVILQFEDGKAAILNINTNGTPRLQHQPNLFIDNSDPSIGLYTVFPKKANGGDDWHEYTNVTQEEVAKYNSATGVELKLVRRGKYLYAFLDDVYKGTAELPEEYADDKVGFGMFSFGAQVGEWHFGVSTDLDVSSIENTTATDANGTISLDKTTGVKLGDVITVTVAPANGFALNKLTIVGGTNVERKNSTTFTFVASKSEITVNATFSEPVPVSAAVSGIGLNNSTESFIGKTLVFTPDSGVAPEIVVGDEGNISGKLLIGNYTVSVKETATPFGSNTFNTYYDVEVEVGESGFVGLTNGLKFTRRLFQTNAIGEPTNNIFGNGNPVVWSADNTKAATEGKIVSTKDGKMYEWSLDLYDDVAITVTLKSGNGNQGLIMRFDKQQKDVRLRFENTKAQWIGGGSGGWWWGSSCITDTWDFSSGAANPMNSTLLDKYDCKNGATGLDLTLLRKGGMVYALIDGKLYSAQSVADFADKKVQLAIFAEGSKTDYEVPFTISTNVDEILAEQTVDVGEDLNGYFGTWTENENTLKVDGARGYSEFKAPENTVKESATIHIKDDVGGDQGLMYRFANGKYIAVRYQKAGGNYKVQYTMDTVYYNGGSLRNWTDWAMNAQEKAEFDASGLDLRFVRDGKVFYTLLGDRVLDVATLGDEYASMGGAMAIMIWDSKGGAFAYSHVTGDDAIPSIVNVSVSAGETHGYDVWVDQNYNGSVTLTIKTGSNWGSAWSWFPTSVKVNSEEKFVATNMVSNGANHLTYTLILENVTADTNIEVTIGKGVTIENGVSVTTAGGSEGCTAVSDSGANGYYWNDGCDIHIKPAEGYEIASISYKRRADEGEPNVVTEGWAEVTGKNYTYSYTLPISITEPTDVVVTFKAVSSSQE